MQYNPKEHPCKFCPGTVTFFKSFHDCNGVVHYAKNVFVRCTNPECPGKSENVLE